MKLYTYDEIYERADGKAHLSPELKAKDEAQWELACYISETFGIENPFEESWRTGCCAEDILDDYDIELRPMFNEAGSMIMINSKLLD